MVFGYLSVLRFESFNSSVDDLGFFNQVLWMTLHGGPSAWTTYSETSFNASYPWQTSSFLLLVPVYAVFPSPITLLLAQSIGVSLATVPIYLLARRYRFSAWASFGLGGCYLLSFQLQAANLNDFHLQSFYPLTFFSMVLFHEYGWKKWFLVAGAVSLVTNPMTLVLTVAFLGGQLLKESSPGPTLSKLVVRLVGWVRARNVESLLLLLGVLLAVFEIAVGLIGQYHVGTSPAQSGSQGYFSDFSARALYFVLAFVPFLFLAFFVRETLLLLIPLLAFLALGNISFFGYIGHPDAIEFLVVGLWGLMLFAKEHTGASLLGRARRSIRYRRSHSFKTRSVPHPNFTVVTAVLVGAVLFVGFSPVSPWNQVPQWVGDVNENPSNIVDVTPADHFLTSVIALIPENASVLTQNNIPQLTGRDTFLYATANGPRPNISQADYILADQSTDSFARLWYSFLQPYVRTALNSGEFGISAIGYGVLLLQRGFHGPPELIGPLPYSPSEMSLSSGYRMGSIAVHPAQNNSFFWYGPYVDLPAGNYTATYHLMIGPGASPSASIITVAVSNHTSSSKIVYASSELFAYDFPAPDTWTDVSINFTLDSFVSSVEFPGLSPTSAAVIEFGGVTVTVEHLALS